MTLYFQTNFDFVYRIMIVTSMFGGIVKNARCQHVFEHRHTGLSPGVMVRCAPSWYGGNVTRPPLVSIDCTLISGPYISVVLRPVALPFVQTLQNAKFQQDNA